MSFRVCWHAVPPVRTPTPSDSCDAKFMPYFRKFTDANLQVAKQAVADCLTKLRGHKNWRPDIVRSLALRGCQPPCGACTNPLPVSTVQGQRRGPDHLCRTASRAFGAQP